jgi:hypothetical protein
LWVYCAFSHFAAQFRIDTNKIKAASKSSMSAASAANDHLGRPSKSILSFVAWTASIFVYLCFVAWALLPAKTLHAIGVTYYPSRYYAIALPAYVLNLLSTNDPEELATIRDVGPAAGVALKAPLSFIRCGAAGVKDGSGIPEIGDIDPVLVSTALVK